MITIDPIDNFCKTEVIEGFILTPYFTEEHKQAILLAIENREKIMAKRVAKTELEKAIETLSIIRQRYD